MPFNYVDNMDAIVNVLTAHNTTTASPYLSEGLSTVVSTIEDRDWEVQQFRNHDAPGVFVRIANKDEDFGSLGDTGPTKNRKMAEVTYQVLGMYKKDGLVQEHADLQRMVYTLARNIEGVFQAEMTLSNTALFCNVVRTDFSGSFQNGGAWLKGVMVELRARYLFR